MQEGPLLESLLRRLAETPSEFTEMPRIGNKGTIHVDAVVQDLLVDLGGGEPLDPADAARFIAKSGDDTRRLQTVLIAAWLLHDRWFIEQRRFAAAALAFLKTGVDDLSALVDPPKLISDADRREELVRLALAALDLRPQGENENVARDRMSTLSSAERQRVILETRAAQERIRQVQEAMRRKQAEEAAASYGRE